MKNRLIVLWRTFCMHVPFLRSLLGYPMCVVFIRHAESVNNKAFQGKLFLERKDQVAEGDRKPDHRIELSEAGKQQAQKTGPHLRRRFGLPDAVIHSGHVRTRQTMQGMLSAYGGAQIPLFEERRFREREAGHTYLMPRESVEQNFPYLQSYWNLVGGFYARPPSGESLADVLEKRLIAAFAELRERFAGKRVFVFTHGRVIQCMRMLLDELNIDQIEAFLATKEENPENCSFMVYRYSPKHGKLVLTEYNTTWWDKPLPSTDL